MKSKAFASVLFWASVIAVVLGLLDAMSVNVWLAASTWLVVAAVLGIWAIYTNAK
ncbi:MAG: hypothetical protein NTY30_04485 [Candidatus Berkelbacteria bacterium]|nr:hypothetical protein [Candidatus Berkelbacteria bacterium]